jgi:hypothetical protein
VGRGIREEAERSARGRAGGGRNTHLTPQNLKQLLELVVQGALLAAMILGVLCTRSFEEVVTARHDADGPHVFLCVADRNLREVT